MSRSKRRWLIRALGWAIGGFASVVAVLLLALAAYLLFTDYPEKLRSTLESELANLAGAPATIRAISLDLPHYAFALEGVSVGVPGHSGPVLELESVWGRLRLSEILNLRLHWSELVVSGLTLHLFENADEGLTLTTRRAESGPLARVGMAADHVSIQRAVIVIENEKVPWELEASNLSLDLTRVGAEMYHGKLAYDDGRLRIKDHEEIRASVEADFELVPHELLLKEARVQSDIGQLLSTGKLAFAEGARGRFDVTAEGEVGRTIESLFGLREAEGLVKGTATFRGSLAVEPGNKTLAGTLLLPQGNVAGIPLTHWKAEVFWDRSLLQVSYAQGMIAGGGARLQLHQPLPVHEHLASLDVDFERVSLAGILRESRGLASPVDSLLGGRVSLSFSAVVAGELQGQFEIAGQAPPSENETAPPVPLSGHAKGTVGGAGLVLDDANIETPFLRGALSGTYPRKGLARLVVDFESSRLEDVDRLQRDLRRLFVDSQDKAAHPLPDLLGIGGRGEARGIVTGKLPDLSFDGELAADRLRIASIDLGAVRSRLSIAGERLGLGDLAAHIGDGALAGRADMSIEGSLRDRDFDLDLTLSRWPVEELSRVLGASVSLDGSASGRIVARRSRARLDGGASLELENGSIAGVVFDRGEARLGLDGATIRVDPFTLVRDGASAKGRLEINLENRLLGGSISTRELELGSLGLDGALSGTVEGQFDLSGRIESPQGSLSGRGRNIRLKGVELGEAFVTGNLHGGDLDVRMSLERHAAEIVVEGSVRLAEDYPARAQVRWHGLDTAAWMGIPSEAAGGLTALSDGVGNVRFPLKAADLLAAARGEGEVSQFVLEGENYRIASVAPIRVHLENARLALDEAELAEGRSRLTIGGSMDLASDSLDLKAEGVVSLGVLQSLYPGLSATGETTLSAAVTGSRERPSLIGYADLQEGSVRLEGFRQAIGGLTGRLVFDNRTVRVSDLHGVFGSGPVAISGTVGLEGIQPSTFDLTVRGSGVRLRYPEGLVATLEGDLSFLGSANERMVSGALVLRDAVWSREYDLVSGMLSDREGLDLFPDLTESEALKDVRLDVSIRAPESLKVRNGLTVLEASADLELRGTLGHPVLLGQAEAQHGEIYFMGQRYNITRGKVDFVDPTKVEPFVDLTAETRVRSYNVQLRLTGTPQRFYPELTSDPPLRTVDILRLLAGANERDILVGTEEEEIAGVGVASLLTERLSQEVGKRAERLFGLDRFSIDPFLIGQFSDPTARVSLGKQNHPSAQHQLLDQSQPDDRGDHSHRVHTRWTDVLGALSRRGGARGNRRQVSQKLLSSLMTPILLFVLGLAGGAGPGATDSPRESATASYLGRRIHEVKIELEGGEVPEASRELIELSSGDPYQPEAVRRSIKQLFALGAFSDVKVEAFPIGDDEVDVLFRLFPRPQVQVVEIAGLEDTDPHLASLRSRMIQESQLHPGDSLEVENLAEAAKNISDLLHEEGYLWAQVEPEASFHSPNASVVFHVDAGERARVRTVAIEGVAPYVEADIRRELDLAEGSPYSRKELDKKIDELASRWKELGFYGATVGVDERTSGDRRVDVRITPEVGPRVRVEVSGWDFSQKELDKLVPLFAETKFTADLVEESRANLEEYVKGRGYRDASVTVDTESDEEGRHLTLHFLVASGPKIEIRAIEIEGLHSVPEAQVRALLVTRSRRRVSSAPFRQKVWDADLEEVRTYLKRQGFHAARVDGLERAVPDEPDLVTLIIRVDKGPRATVGSIGIDGATEIDSTKVLEAAHIASGAPFDTSEVVAARERILTLYRNEGFRQVEVEARTSLGEEGTRAELTFTVQEGRRTRVDRVIFSGLRVTRESAVRKLVTLRPGEPLSALATLETRQKLIGSGLFRSVDIEPLPPDPVTRRSDVLITVEEGPRTTFAYGFGYQEQQLARAEFEVTRRNLFGLNRTLSIFSRAGFRGGRFITTYRQPQFLGTELPVFVTAYAEQEDRTSFDYNRVGVGLQISKRVSHDQNLLLRYRFDQTRVFRLQVDIDEIDRRFRNTRISAISLASVTDRRDDPLNPRKGQFRILDVEWSAKALGTEVPYIKGLAQQFFYIRLPHQMVGAIGLRLGVAQTLLPDVDTLIPIAERFFIGGATTLRGFALDEASPKRKIPLPNGDVIDGEPIGGNVLALVNFELRFPIFRNLRGVVFSDNGNVYRRLEVIELLNWRYNMGFGFRYDTPLGPLRVDYGFKLDRRTVLSIDCPDMTVPCEESRGQWHVSLGHAF